MPRLGPARAILLAVGLLLATGRAALAAEPPVPTARGFVTDLAGVIPADAQRRMTRTIQALKDQTGSEIAVLTVPSTEPLDDFTYAMKVADTWKVGARGEDTGVLILVATQDRKLRILTGYGVEGVLPDGLVGRIQDREMLPAFRAGRIAEGLERGVTAIAARIIDGRAGKPPPHDARDGGISPLTLFLLMLLVFLFLSWLSNQTSQAYGPRRRSRRYPGGFGGGGFGSGFPLPPGGFGGGGGGFDGFGGFGGGGFGGGGAGRSW